MYYSAYSNIQQMVTAAGFEFLCKYFFVRTQTNFLVFKQVVYCSLSPTTTVLCCSIYAHQRSLHYLAYNNIQHGVRPLIDGTVLYYLGHTICLPHVQA